MKIRLVTAMAMIVSLINVIGCSKAQKADGKVEVKHEPVTVSIGVAANHLSEDEFKQYIVEPVSKKYPWITVARESYVQGRSLNELIAAGETPDLIWHTNIGSSLSDLVDKGLSLPLTDLIKKHNFDLNRIEPEAIDALKAASGQNDLIGLPYTRHFSAMFYNKDIFDKFGVAYPTDNMTWEQTYELAKKLTRMEDGIQYRGLEPNVTERPASQLSLPFIDPKTLQAQLQTDSWKKVMDLVMRIHQIPGNEQITFHGAADKLFVEGKLAMEPTINILYEANFKAYPDLKWDLVSYPVWPEAPGLGMRIDAHVMALTSTSKHKDEAFLVLSTLLSDEVQMNLSRHARFSILKDQKIRDSFGADIDFLKGKNVQAIYKTKPAKSFPPTKYDSLAMSAINQALDDIMKKGKDINTVLREAEEKANKQIREKEAALK